MPGRPGGLLEAETGPCPSHQTAPPGVPVAIDKLMALDQTCFGMTRRSQPFLTSRFHIVSLRGLVGGGRLPRPGEITLSHRGVLFLDELPEFGHPALESHRQPMEDQWVTISRAGVRKHNRGQARGIVGHKRSALTVTLRGL